MYEINLMFKNDGWQKHPWKVGPCDMCESVKLAIQALEIALDSKPYQLLPVGMAEFIIWSQGSCIGLLSIKKAGPETSAKGLEVGQ